LVAAGGNEKDGSSKERRKIEAQAAVANQIAIADCSCSSHAALVC
jgi:hypothetical protein